MLMSRGPHSRWGACSAWIDMAVVVAAMVAADTTENRGGYTRPVKMEGGDAGQQN